MPVYDPVAAEQEALEICKVGPSGFMTGRCGAGCCAVQSGSRLLTSIAMYDSAEGHEL